MLVIVGPTAAGKSALAIELARRFDGEVINYDSVQVYRGFDVGSGKVSPAERQGISHHLLDVVEAGQVFTAGDYRREAIATLGLLGTCGKLPVLVGGTGLYLRALLQGLFEGPRRSEELRSRLRGLVNRRGRAFLHRMLRRLDPASAERIHPNDTQKVLRAVEVCLVAREPLSRLLVRDRSAHMGHTGLQGFRIIKVGLDPDRAELYRRINTRVERMFAQGLVDEARAALARATSEGTAAESRGIKPLGALGYREAYAFLRGEITMETAVLETQTATRRYAKRQMTWFRHEAGVTWFRGFGDDPEVQRQIIDWLRREE
jgi:tRNA dimethylallyltransferase